MVGRFTFGIVLAISLALLMPTEAFAKGGPSQASATTARHATVLQAAPAAKGGGNAVSNRQENKIIAGSTLYPVGSGLNQQQISLGGCGFLQNCIFFNQKDQRAILQGGAAAIAAVICLVGSPAACAVAAVVVAVALVYLGDHGICSRSRRLRVRWFPAPGGATCVS